MSVYTVCAFCVYLKNAHIHLLTNICLSVFGIVAEVGSPKLKRMPLCKQQYDSTPY